MKRLLAFAVLVLGLASCQQDFDAPVQVGGEVDFQLSVAAPEIAGTRAGDVEGQEQNAFNSAYGAIDYLQGANDQIDEFRTDWSDVDLRYTLEVYDVDEEGNVTHLTPVKDRMVMIVDKYQPVTFDLRLVPNRKYRFVVFADFVDNDNAMDKAAVANIDDQKELDKYYEIGATLQDIKVIAKTDAINDECTDAYFATKDITIENSAAQDMQLKRPFGKVRVIATDLAELNINVDPAKVEVTYTTDVPNKFNALTGEIAVIEETKQYFVDEYNDISKLDLSKHYYTVDYDAKKATNANGVERHTHMTLFTDYILANAEQTPFQFTMTVWDKNKGKIKETLFNTDIPVERNKLTTIIGNVLTTATEINITIDDNFDGYHNVNYVGVASARELQEALNNAQAGENNVINFEADINAVAEEYNPIIITEIPETTIVLNGNGYKFNGCMQIKGMSEYKNAHTVFQNINFETADASSFMGDAFIFCDDEPNTSFRYPDSVTIKGCSFTATGAAVKNAVGVKMWSLQNNLVVEDCTANGMHSMVQLTSSGEANVTINGAVIESSKNGISLGQVTTATIKNVNINTVNYGIRLDGANSSTTTIEKATINAFIPVNVRKMNNDAHNVVVEFVDNAAGLKGNTYEIAFCSNDYEEGVEPQAPKGTFTLQNAEEADAFYGTVTSFSAFDAAINSTNAPEVKAESDITKLGEGVEVERNVTIDFDNKVFNVGSTASSTWYALEITGEYDVDIKNANFTRAGIMAEKNANVVFWNGTINHKPERSSRYIFCAWSGSTITIKDGTFTNDREKNTYFWADAATIIVEGGVFNGVKPNKGVAYTSNGGKVIIKGGTFKYDPTAWLAPGYSAVKNGSNWEVTFGTAVDGATVLTGVENTTIDLAAGEYGAVTLGTLKNVTIKGSEDANVIFTTTADSVLENVTLEGVEFEYTNTQNFGLIINASATINNLVLDGCSFVGPGTKTGHAIHGHNNDAEITVRNCTFKDMGYPIYDQTNNSGFKHLMVDNCTFENIKSWAIMPLCRPYLGQLTINNCKFNNCTGGLVKTGTFEAGNTFTFTNNSVTNSAGHDGKETEWFTVNANGTAVVSGNTKDGVEWTPGAEQGLN